MAEHKAVILMGSRNDLDFATSIIDFLKQFQVEYELRIASAHKTPRELLRILEGYERSQAQVVYITVAGLSDALSGTVAGFTKYPVIACPPDSKKYGWTKVFSSMITPRGVSVLFAAEPENAALAATKILALSNGSLQKNIAKYQQKKGEDVVEADKEMKEGR